MPHATTKNVLLTGPPGCGKTTVVRRVIERLGDLRLAGFYTQEIRQHGQRVGFEAIGLAGSSAILAHVDFQGGHRVGRYGVDLARFEALVRAELSRPPGEVDIFVIDEIGKMECFSSAFVAVARRLLNATTPVLATIAAKGGGFITEVKMRPDVEIIAVSLSNRDGLPGQLVAHLGRG
jgi:nucleoside-triphosphatase